MKGLIEVEVSLLKFTYYKPDHLNHFKVYNSLLLVDQELGNYHHSEDFPEKISEKTCTTSVSSHCPLTQPLLTTNQLFLYIDVPILDLLPKWDLHTVCGFLCLVSFT